MTAAHPELGLIDATATDLDGPWARVHRVSPPAPLTCRGCGSALSAKVSKLGLRFFSHRAAVSGCPINGETVAHRLLKIELAAAIRDSGWHAELEVPGNGWRADVLATSPDGSRRLAWEAQLASATSLDLTERTATMAADGVEVCWVSDKDTTWLTHVPSARVRRPDGEAGATAAGHGQPALGVIDGHGQFTADWCDDRSRCDCEDDFGTGRAPCPGHGSWETGRELPLTAFVAAVCSGVVRLVATDERVFSRKHGQFRGTALWVTRAYWALAAEQARAQAVYEAWARPYVERREADFERAERAHEQHMARIEDLLARQRALIRPTVEWVYQSAGTYPKVEDGQRTERFSMGVPVFIGEKLHALICPVALRITPKLAGWYSTATIVVADETEQARIAKVTRSGQRFRVIDPGPIEAPKPASKSASLSMNQVLNRMFRSW